jgi:ferredoxin
LPNLALHLGPRPRLLPAPLGAIVREVLEETPWRLRSGCRGTGACGHCRLELEPGAVSPPTPVEELYLEPEELARGVRLGCQARLTADSHARSLVRARRSPWRSVPAGQVAPPPAQLPQPRAGAPRALGLAIVYRGGHWRLAIADLQQGAVQATRSGPADWLPADPPPAAAPAAALEDCAMHGGIAIERIGAVVAIGDDLPAGALTEVLTRCAPGARLRALTFAEALSHLPLPDDLPAGTWLVETGPPLRVISPGGAVHTLPVPYVPLAAVDGKLVAAPAAVKAATALCLALTEATAGAPAVLLSGPWGRPLHPAPVTLLTADATLRLASDLLLRAALARLQADR